MLRVHLAPVVVFVKAAQAAMSKATDHCHPYILTIVTCQRSNRRAASIPSSNAAPTFFTEADYGRNLDRDGEPTKAFEPSLFVWATVMSRPTADRAIVDAGLKALAFDSGPPLVCDEPAATYERASDEHGRLAVSAATNRLGLGDKIRLIPGHCDPTVNLYDWYVCIRANRVDNSGRSPPAAPFINEETGAPPGETGGVYSSGIPALRRPSRIRSRLSRARGSLLGLLKRALYAFHAAIVLSRALEGSAR